MILVGARQIYKNLVFQWMPVVLWLSFLVGGGLKDRECHQFNMSR